MVAASERDGLMTDFKILPQPLRLRRAGWTLVEQLRGWTRSQWKVVGWTYLVSLLLMGVVGETLPGASYGRVVPVAWWNWLTLLLSPVLIALIAGTFIISGDSKRARRTGKAGTGAGAAVGTIAMACPVCNPLAIPLFGTSGLLSFLAPLRGLIAALSIGLLLVTLVIRLRTIRACRIDQTPRAEP
jgi:hypothetical protein